MEPSVQQQIADRYRSLKTAIDDRKKTSAELANEYGAMGSLLLAVDYAEAAEPFYRHAEAISPGDMRWPYYLGHVYMAKSEPAKAIDSFERALRSRPNDVATLVWLGNVQLDQGRADLAEPRFSQALQLQPHLVAALFGLGRVALARRDYARAVEQLEAVLAADPRASIAHYPLSLAYRGLGDTTRAEAHLRQRGDLAIGPPDPLMAELRGLVHVAIPEQQRRVAQIANPDFIAGRQRMAVTDYRLDALVIDRRDVEYRFIEGRPRKYHIELRVAQLLVDVVGTVDVFHVEGDLGTLFRELDAQAVHHVPQAPPDADPDSVFDATGQLTRRITEFSPRRIEGARLLEQPAAVLSERDPLAVTQEQRHTELLFELVDVTAERGLRDMEPLSGPGDAQRIGNSNERFDVPEVHCGRILYQFCIPGH